MLGGIAPIFLFNFSKIIPGLSTTISAIPIVSEEAAMIPFPPIPIYLDERLTGVYIDSENKNVDAETSTETVSSGATPTTNQKAINSVVTINMLAKKDSIGIILLSAMIDIIYGKLTSKEYSVTYLHGAVTVFGGLLHSFSINQNADSELCQISIQLVRNTSNTLPKSPIPVVIKNTGALPL